MNKAIRICTANIAVIFFFALNTNAQWAQTGSGTTGVLSTPNSVAIGTTAPSAKLHVAGPRIYLRNNGEVRYHLYNGGGQAEWLFGQKSATDHNFILSKRVGAAETDFININPAGRFHIDGPELLYLLNQSGVIVSKAWGGNGNLTVEGNLSVTGDMNMSAASTVYSTTSLNLAGGIARAVLSTSGTTGVATFTSTSGNGVYSFVTGTGYVKIGAVTTPNPAGYKLFVDQGILTEKVKVAVAGSAQWADHVFHQNYQLMPLEEVEQFIQQNKHLPNIPSADEMVKEGNDLGKTDAKLLEKIEELTLYLIQLNRKVDKLENENRALKEKLNPAPATGAN
ncbi:MAG: hypothetical protein JNM68_08445 [Dinghuibacter sp.]|nr:hypothetical protein [Dinghuibacter sp.]